MKNYVCNLLKKAFIKHKNIITVTNVHFRSKITSLVIVYQESLFVCLLSSAKFKSVFKSENRGLTVSGKM